MEGNTEIENTLEQKWHQYDSRKRISTTFPRWYPEGSAVSNFLLYLRTEKTLPNLFLKSVLGFLGGIILTYLCFLFFVFQLSISVINATIMSSTIGVLLTFGLAFSFRIRCLVFLLIPQLFSRVGRYTLTCYALVLILTGPATNTLKNSEVLTESMACSQEQIKLHVREMNDAQKNPYNVVKDSLSVMMKRFKAIAAATKIVVVRFNRLVLSIVGSIHSGFAWLQSISDHCNAKLGTPYQRCLKMLKRGEQECRNSLDPNFSWVCKAANIGKVACVAVKPYNSFCHTIEFMDEAIVATIKKKLNNFSAQMSYMFQVKLHVQHSRALLNASSSASQVAAGIVTEIRHKADPLLTWLSWSSCVTSLFLVLIIFRAKHYQNMYETRSRFDNHYITKELKELDFKRQQQGRRTILPLNRRERAKYITTTSFRLVSSEIVNMNRSVVFMIITTFKLLIHMVADYSLYWVLMTIRHHGRLQSNLTPGVPRTGTQVTGNGFISRLFRSIIATLDIPLSEYSPSPIPCLPNPHPPDLRRYTQIGVLIFLLWFFALFEPYGLRLRHIIMGHYQPDRARDRAMWLFQYILRTRAGFMKFARRKLHRQYKYYSKRHMTFREWLNKHIPFRCFKFIFGIGKQDAHCLLCGIQDLPNDLDAELIRCKTPKCPGTYCESCFTDIGELCTICLSPADYGDFSDVSLEAGSSDESSDDENGEQYGQTRPTNERESFKWRKLRKYDNSSSSKHDNITRVYKQLSSDKIGQQTTLNAHKDSNYEDLFDNFIRKNKESINTFNYSTEVTTGTEGQIESVGNHYSYYEMRQYIKVNTDWAYKENKTIDHNLDKTKLLQNISIISILLIELFPFLVTDDIAYRQNGNSKSRNYRSTAANTNDLKKESGDASNKINILKEKHVNYKEIVNSNDANDLKNKLPKDKSSNFQTFLFRNWDSVKFTLIPCICCFEADRSIDVKKNHKQRKKEKSIKGNKTEKDGKRNYRIAAFLADLEWNRQVYNTKEEWAVINAEGLVEIEMKKHIFTDTIHGRDQLGSNVSKLAICQDNLLKTSVEDIQRTKLSAEEIATIQSITTTIRNENFRERLMDMLFRNKLFKVLFSSSSSDKSTHGYDKDDPDTGGKTGTGWNDDDDISSIKTSLIKEKYNKILNGTRDILSDEIKKRFKSSLIILQDLSSLCRVSPTHLSRSVQCINVIKDAAVGSTHRTCTCATQYFTKSEDDETLRTQSCDNHTIDMTTLDSVVLGALKANRVIVPDIHERAAFKYNTRISRKESKDLLLRDPRSITPSPESNETKTDTTFCSLATVEYHDMTSRCRRNTTVITKQNQATCTERRQFQDVGTMTILPPRGDTVRASERKDRVHGDLRTERRRKTKFKTCAVGTEGKFVSFRSFAQIIPPGTSWDVLSPLRYLLEVLLQETAIKEEDFMLVAYLKSSRSYYSYFAEVCQIHIEEFGNKACMEY